MFAGETISIFVLGRILVAAMSTLYVTIDGQDQLLALGEQPVNQHFAMVQTPSMGKSFMLVEYPFLRKVLKATKLPLDIPMAAKLVVEELDENVTLVHGGASPRDFSTEYQFSLVQADISADSNTTLSYFIFSEDPCALYHRVLIQAGKFDSAGQANAPIILDPFNNVEWERFSFSNPPVVDLSEH